MRYLSNILKQFQANEVNNNKICFHSDGKLRGELVTLRFSISVAIALTSLLSSLFQNEISYTRSPESDRKVCTRLQIGPPYSASWGMNRATGWFCCVIASKLEPEVVHLRKFCEQIHALFFPSLENVFTVMPYLLIRRQNSDTKSQQGEILCAHLLHMNIVKRYL